MDNQHRLIAGYRDLTPREVELINMIKSLEREVGQLWLQVGEDVPTAERRDLDVARTHFQEGFSAFVRAVARPEDPFTRVRDRHGDGETAG